MNPAIIIIIVFPIFFIALWLGVTFILAKVGWSKLIPFYEHKSHRFDGEYIGTASGSFKWVNYNGVLKLSFNHHGLHLMPIKIFSAFHKPVMIPWEDISMGGKVNLAFIKYYPLTVQRDGDILATIRLSAKQIVKVKPYLK